MFSMIRRFQSFIIALAVLAVLGVAYWIYSNTSLSFNQKYTSVAATQIKSFKEIGQWEFLAINTEEIVDSAYTTEHRAFDFILMSTENRIARIYSGTLRLGFDLKEDVKNNPDWVKLVNDTTITVTLPKIHLLDENFLDEAATRPLIEEGEWSHEAKGLLAKKAQRQLKVHNVSATNLKRAEEVAKEQVTTLLTTMGFTNANIEMAK